MLAAELAPEQLVPLHINEGQAAGGVEYGDQFAVLSADRQIPFLMVVENAENALVPPLVAEACAQLARDVRGQDPRSISGYLR